MIETEAGIYVYKYEVIKQFYWFLYILFSFASGGKYSPTCIHQKVFNDLYYFHKVELLWERN